MRKLLLIIFLLSLNTGLSAQTLEGFWISSCRMDVKKRTESTDLEGDESMSKQLKKIEIDTSYYNAYALIHFLNNREVELLGIGGKKVNGTYTKTQDTISVEMDTISLKFLHRNDNVILLDLDSGWINNYLIFEKMLPSSSLSKDKIEIDFEKESYWKISADSNSGNYGLELHFLDSGIITISKFYNEWFASTSWGEYKTTIIEDNLFLYIFDRNTFYDRMFRIYSDSKNILYAQNFNNQWGEERPSKQEIEMVRATLPNKKELRKMKKSLLGEWILGDTHFPFDTLFSLFKGFDDQYYNLRFLKNGDFRIEYGGVLVNDNNRSVHSNEIKGTWQIGQTGRFIETKVDSGYLEYITIIDITANSLFVSMNTESLDRVALYNHYPIRLKKDTPPLPGIDQNRK